MKILGDRVSLGVGGGRGRRVVRYLARFVSRSPGRDLAQRGRLRRVERAGGVVGRRCSEGLVAGVLNVVAVKGGDGGHELWKGERL